MASLYVEDELTDEGELGPVNVSKMKRVDQFNFREEKQKETN